MSSQIYLRELIFYFVISFICAKNKKTSIHFLHKNKEKGD